MKLDTVQILPPEIGTGSNQRFKFICGCKKVFICSFKSVVSGNTTTCGKCSWKSRDYWLEQKWGRLKLDPNQELPEEIAPWSLKRFWFLCQCAPDRINRKRLPFGFVAGDGQLSCGCIKPGMSEDSPMSEIRDYVKSITSEPILSNDRIALDGKELDLYIPSKKFAIEYQGLIWHSEYCHRGEQDYDKFLLARSKDIRLIQIYGDEWRDKREIIKAHLREILVPKKGIPIDPVFEVIQGIPPLGAQEFLNTHHYLGSTIGCMTVVAKYKEEIVGVWVFVKQEEKVVLWVRACWNHDYEAMNPHKQALNLVIPIFKGLGFRKISAFSNNRLYTGRFYTNLGFSFAKEIPPDYSYVKGEKRIPKSDFHMGAAKGWYRIWDSGMQHYTLVLEDSSSTPKEQDKRISQKVHQIALQKFLQNPSKAYQRYITDIYAEKEEKKPGLISELTVREISKKEAQSVILKYEWLQTMPMGAVAYYGLMHSDSLIGVTCFSKVAGGPSNLCTSPKSRAICLSRGACTPLAPKNSASFLIRRACKLAYKKYGWNIFFAYSDKEAGEIGTVYQASNWLYLGNSTGRKANGYHADYISPDASRTITSYAINHDKGKLLAEFEGEENLKLPLRKLLIKKGWNKIKRYGKGKWVWFEGSCTLRKEIKNSLRYPIIANGSKEKPYPKRLLK